jgi:hypothetical protein
VIPGDPVQIASTYCCWGVGACLSDGRLSVSWSTPGTIEFATLPWLEPEQTVHTSLPATVDTALSFNQLFEKNGAVLSLGYWREPTWRISQSIWSTTAALTDGPHWHAGYPDRHLSPASGAEVMDGEGRVVVATLAGMADSEDVDSTILFALDRFGPEGFRETLVSGIYDWTTQLPEVGGEAHIELFPHGGTFEEEESVAAFGVSDFGAVVFAQATLQGIVLQPPRVAVNPPEYQAQPSSVHAMGASFARKADTVVGIVQLYGNFDAVFRRYYSVLFDLDGNVIDGPYEIEPLQNGMASNTGFGVNDLVSWGERFAYCYYENDDDSYNILVLNQEGQPAGNPVRLMSDACQGSNPSCSVEVIDQSTLAVVVAVVTSPLDSGLNGPYLVVVTDPSLQ